jgi:hypothetical protein
MLKLKMSKPVAVNKSISTPYYIGGVDLVDFLLPGNRSTGKINLIDLALVIDNIGDYGNGQPDESTS